MAITKKETDKKPITKYRKDKKENYISEIEYLERELLAETKSEYHDGKIVAMAGAQ